MNEIPGVYAVYLNLLCRIAESYYRAILWEFKNIKAHMAYVEKKNILKAARK